MNQALQAGPQVAVCDQRSPQGFGPQIVLFSDRLMLESRGPLGGGLRHEIPVASIRGFYAVTYQYKTLSGASQGDAFDQFLVAWDDATGKRRVTKWMIDVRTEPFQALLAKLAELRPDASLLHLPSGDAHRALGVRSLAQLQVLVVGLVLAGTVIVVAIVIAAVVLLR